MSALEGRALLPRVLGGAASASSLSTRTSQLEVSTWTSSDVPLGSILLSHMMLTCYTYPETSDLTQSTTVLLSIRRASPSDRTSQQEADSGCRGE